MYKFPSAPAGKGNVLTVVMLTYSPSVHTRHRQGEPSNVPAVRKTRLSCAIPPVAVLDERPWRDPRITVERSALSSGTGEPGAIAAAPNRPTE